VCAAVDPTEQVCDLAREARLDRKPGQLREARRDGWADRPRVVVHRRGIEVLKFNEVSVVISRGLSPGEKVVTAGVNSLAEGDVVKPETEVN
jgi:hypothetical protein